MCNAIVNPETINNNNSNKVNALEEHLDLEEQTKRNTEANTSKSTINVTNNNSVLTITEDDNIKLDFEDLNIEVNDPNELKEVDLSKDLENTLETITLKKPNQVYYEIYKAAREKAKEAKKAAVIAYLEAKNIKKTYMLDDIDDSDDSDLEEDSDFYEDSEYEN